MFLFIVVSGMYLWWPRTFTWAAIRNITWFRGRLPARARDFNWHNTIGFWSAIPLAIVVAGGVVISYPWATALVYRAYGEQPPAPAATPRSGAPAGAQSAAAIRKSPAVTGDESSHAALETFVGQAALHMPDWKSLSVALPSNGATRVVVTLDSGEGGQPHKRATLTLDRRTGEVERWEPFTSQSAGRRARTWLRFAHTGEIYGGIGQTLAGIVTGGAAVLVWTGLAMALRRLASWRRRRSSTGLQKAA